MEGQGYKNNREPAYSHLNGEGVPNFDPLHPLRAQHVVREQLHSRQRGQANLGNVEDQVGRSIG